VILLSPFIFILGKNLTYNLSHIWPPNLHLRCFCFSPLFAVENAINSYAR